MKKNMMSNNQKNNETPIYEETKVNSSLLTSFDEIETPTTVEEFRENLLKYYVSMERTLYVQSDGYPQIKVDEIESMEDLFPNDFQWNGSDYHHPNLMVTPTVIDNVEFESKFDMKSVFLIGLDTICTEWWRNPKNTTIVEYGHKDSWTTFEKLSKGDIKWYPYWDENSRWRDYHQKVLGEFSGMGTYEEVN